MQNSFVVVAPSLGKLTLNCYFHRSRHLHQVGCHIKFPPLLYSLLILRANCYCAKFKFNLILVTWLCGVPLWKELREVLQKLFVIKPSLFFRGFSRRGDDNNRVIKWLSHESSKKNVVYFHLRVSWLSVDVVINSSCFGSSWVWDLCCRARFDELLNNLLMAFDRGGRENWLALV